ncbi:MAG TPA: SDR family NAD(P)-dependent oxidoreductase, partial [Polyangiaceae bacterium]
MANDRKRGWAVITGASSGLGAEFARQLAARGYDVVLTARRRDRMEALASELRAASNVETLVLESDLGAPDAPARLLAALDERGISPELLVNNAGFGVHGLAVQEPLPRQLAMIDLNVRALTELS